MVRAHLFGRVVTFAHGLLPSLIIAFECRLATGATPSQRLVREEHTDQDRHGSDQEPYGQVSQSPGPLRATACSQGPERGEAEPGHGVQRIAIDDRGNSPDQPQRCGDPHENPEALSACSSSSAHFLTLRVPGWDTVSISSSGPSRYSLQRLKGKHFRLLPPGWARWPHADRSKRSTLRGCA